jgi:hypothetical protein
MLETKVLAAIQEWIDSCPDSVPLVAKCRPVDEQSLMALIHAYPKLKGTLVEAILGLRIGNIERAHEIVQSGSTSMDRYLHGVVHRIEGDYWNAKYWFQQINDRQLLAKVSDTISKAPDSLEIFELSKSLGIFDDRGQFSPQCWVDAQAALTNTSSPSDRELIQRVAQVEWETLWTLIQDAVKV